MTASASAATRTTDAVGDRAPRAATNAPIPLESDIESGQKIGQNGSGFRPATLNLTDAAGRPVTLREDLAAGLIGYQSVTGEPLCAACLCPLDGHCPQCGCLTAKGTDAECRCARAIAAIPTCADCGGQFPHLWQLQVHRLPTPRCLTSARAASGRHYAAARITAPLKPEVR